MARMYREEVLRDLRAVGYSWTFGTRTLPRGVSKVYEMATGAGNEWVKIHTRRHEPKHRYWVGVNIAAVEQVDSFALWFENEQKMYVVPATYLQEVIKAESPIVTVKGGQWNVNVSVHKDMLSLPNAGKHPLHDFVHWIPFPPRISG